MINSIIDSIAAVLVATLTEYKEIRTTWKAPRTINEGDTPVAMLFDPAVSSLALRDQQEEDVMLLICQLVRKKDEGPAARDDIDAIRDAIRADPTLTGTVDTARVIERASAEQQDARTTAAVVFEIKVVS